MNKPLVFRPGPLTLTLLLAAMTVANTAHAQPAAPKEAQPATIAANASFMATTAELP